MRESGRPRLLDEDAGGRRGALGTRRRLLPDLLDQALQSLQVSLGDPVERIERQSRLILLLGAGQITELPEALRQAILRLDALLHLDLGGEGEHGAVRVGSLLPATFRSGLQRNVGVIARCAHRLLGGVLVGEGHVRLLLSRQAAGLGDRDVREG